MGLHLSVGPSNHPYTIPHVRRLGFGLPVPFRFSVSHSLPLVSKHYLPRDSVLDSVLGVDHAVYAELVCVVLCCVAVTA